MKKIFLVIFTIFVVVSCSLNQPQRNVLDRDNAIQTAEDAHTFAAYMHLGIRSNSAGSSVSYQEIAADLFQPSNSYGNRIGGTFRWQWEADYGLAESIWSSAYYYINHALFFIEKASALDPSTFTQEETTNMSYDMGLAYFTQAYMGHRLIKFFCNNYGPSATTDLGIPIVYEFSPSGDISTFPSRETLENSYQWVLDNLRTSRDYLANFAGKEGSSFLTVDVVDALWARIALDMGDYDTAADKATALISSGKYPLLSTQEEMTALWTNDSGKECIMQMYADLAAQSIPNSNDPGYHAKQSNGKYTPDWILANGITSLYESGDLRLSTWFDPNITVTQANYTGEATLFNKFPGNMKLQTSQAQSSHIQKVKPFRIAEQYLIAAEAYAMKGGSFETAANTYLDQLLEKRVPGYQSAQYSGDNLINAVRTERLKELIGEGFRFFDLKRWGEGMRRSFGMQNPQLIATGGADGEALTLSVEANNYRWLLPIPRYEIDANPQIKEQQNPGY